MPVYVIPKAGNRHTKHLSQQLLRVPTTAPSRNNSLNFRIVKSPRRTPSLSSSTRSTLASKTTFPYQLPFELCKSAQHVQEHAPLRAVRFYGLSEGPKAHMLALQFLKNLGEV